MVFQPPFHSDLLPSLTLSTHEPLPIRASLLLNAATQTLRSVPDLPSWLHYPILGNELIAWLGALATLCVAIILLPILRTRLATIVERITRHTKTQWDNALVAIIRSLRLWCLFPAILYASLRFVVLPERVDRFLYVLVVVGIAFQCILISKALIEQSLEILREKSRKSAEAAGDDADISSGILSSLGVAQFIALIVVVSIIILVALDNLGIAVTPLLTGLGIGGIAVALAVQNVLGDLFASLSIVLDKPFLVGDFIVVGDKMGTVERIGIKTTRIRALSGEQLVFANSDLLSSRIQNYKRMQQRRVELAFTLDFDTPLDAINALLAAIKTHIATAELANFDRAHLAGITDTGLQIQVVYILRSADFNTHMDVQQALLAAIIQRCREHDIEFILRRQELRLDEDTLAVLSGPPRCPTTPSHLHHPSQNSGRPDA